MEGLEYLKEILGLCNLRQLRKQILRLKRCLPPLYPHHSDIPTLRKALSTKTDIYSLCGQKLQSMRKHSWIIHEQLKKRPQGILIDFLSWPRKENFSFIVLGNPFFCGSVALCGVDEAQTAAAAVTSKWRWRHWYVGLRSSMGLLPTAAKDGTGLAALRYTRLASTAVGPPFDRAYFSENMSCMMFHWKCIR